MFTIPNTKTWLNNKKLRKAIKQSECSFNSTKSATLIDVNKVPELLDFFILKKVDIGIQSLRVQ